MKNNVSEHIHQPDANQPSIEILGAREHNLKSIDLTIPRNKLVVFTGLSGSGKSSLAFDTLFAEGQRRYLESFSAYARQFIGDMILSNTIATKILTQPRVPLLRFLVALPLNLPIKACSNACVVWAMALK